MITRYSNGLYPADLWVGFYSDFNKARRIFSFYYDIESLKRDEEPEDRFPSIANDTGGVTYLVRLKKDNAKGILILLNDDVLEKDYSFLLDLISHEASHAVDAFYQIINEQPGNYDSGNEPHAYLTGWVAGCVGESLTKFFKENGSEEV